MILGFAALLRRGRLQRRRRDALPLSFARHGSRIATIARTAPCTFSRQREKEESQEQTHHDRCGNYQTKPNSPASSMRDRHRTHHLIHRMVGAHAFDFGAWLSRQREKERAKSAERN